MSGDPRKVCGVDLALPAAPRVRGIGHVVVQDEPRTGRLPCVCAGCLVELSAALHDLSPADVCALIAFGGVEAESTEQAVIASVALQIVVPGASA